MGKEANFLEAARSGNLQVLNKFISKVKSSSGRPKSHRKLPFFPSYHSHSSRGRASHNRSVFLICFYFFSLHSSVNSSCLLLKDLVIRRFLLVDIVRRLSIIIYMIVFKVKGYLVFLYVNRC